MQQRIRDGLGNPLNYARAALALAVVAMLAAFVAFSFQDPDPDPKSKRRSGEESPGFSSVQPFAIVVRKPVAVPKKCGGAAGNDPLVKVGTVSFGCRDARAMAKDPVSYFTKDTNRFYCTKTAQPPRSDSYHDYLKATRRIQRCYRQAFTAARQKVLCHSRGLGVVAKCLQAAPQWAYVYRELAIGRNETSAEGCLSTFSFYVEDVAKRIAFGLRKPADLPNDTPQKLCRKYGFG